MQISTSPSTATLTITGDLDLAQRDAFPEVLSRLQGLGRQLLVVDMCDVTFLDSTGAAFLISLADAGRRHGAATVLRGAAPRDLFVLEICGVLDMFRLDTEHRCRPTGTGSAAGTGSGTGAEPAAGAGDEGAGTAPSRQDAPSRT